MDSPVEKLVEIIRSDRWLMELLCIVSDIPEARCYIGAGAIRDVVWDRLSGIQEHDAVNDIDVVYFDERQIHSDTDAQLQNRLTKNRSDVEWEVTNQAEVHLWYSEYFGEEIAPYSSIAEAVAS